MPPNLPDYVDLRRRDLADELGVCPDSLRRALRCQPGLGPVVATEQLLELIALIELERIRLGDDRDD